MITPHTLKTFGRSKDIIAILIRHGFGQLMERVGLPGAPFMRKAADNASMPPGASMPIRLRRVLEELGPTFVKFGQVLSTRPELIPESYIRELAKLQEHVSPMPYERVERVIQDELGGKPEEIFASFEREPLASASIGQVHRAVTRNGDIVAVKIQRPNVQSQVNYDLEILSFLAGLLEQHINELQVYRPTEIILEFRHVLAQEMDYTRELRHIEKFRANFAKDRELVVPRPWPELSSSRVLTMEYIPGESISEALGGSRRERKRLAAAGISILLKQIFRDGFFHADPHPGNVRVLPDGRLALLDFGMVGRVTGEMRLRIAELIQSLASRDIERVAEIVREVGEARGEISHDRFVRDIAEIIDCRYGSRLEDVHGAEALADMMSVALSHHIYLPANLSMMLKALITMEQLGRSLDPDIDVVGAAKPYVRRLLIGRYNPRRNAAVLLQSVDEYVRFLKMLPRELGLIVHRLSNGTLTLEFKHVGLEPLARAIERSTNRVSFSLITSALIIGSAIAMRTGVGTRLLGLPAFDVFGFLAAAMMGIWLLVMILRSGRV